jgi:AhpD family alkylhydroperoxidase
MTHFPVLTKADAPEGAGPVFERVQAAYGMVPNLFGVMSAAPGLMEGYLTLATLFRKSSLDSTEQQIVLMTASYENVCSYCMAGHSAGATRQGMPAEIISSLREGRALANPKLETLRQFTISILRQRGQVGPEVTSSFLAAGYTPRNILEVILGLSAKVMSNYTNYFSGTPLDPYMRDFAWNGPDSRGQVMISSEENSRECQG